ncbi:collagen binding domain-containing protein [Paenibacillus sp. NPDC056722]|uniref:collagen binding domain-containing protein n=1 Tax=Paenibacillus sp. NPDC056722 TaxID=3345924 RepID=UPI0036963FA4
MKRKNAGIWLTLLLLFTQFFNSFGFSARASADPSNEISENIITNVTLAVYENGQVVTDNVYKLDSTTKLNLTYELPAGPDGASKYGEGSTYTFTLPNVFLIDRGYSGTLVYDEFPDGIGTYNVGPDNKVVLTFNKNIEGLFDVKGTFNIESILSSTRISGSTQQVIPFPIAGDANNSFVLHLKPKGGTSIKKEGTPKPQKYNPERIEWSVDVNTSLDEIHNAIVTDILEQGLELDLNSISVYKLDVNVKGEATENGALNAGEFDTTGSDASKLNLKFAANPIKEAYRIKFSTKITDSAGLSYRNTAKLTGDGVSKDSSDVVPVDRGKTLEKSATGNYDPVTETIPWEIRFNYNEKTILKDDAVLNDYFNKSQVLDKDSFHVYKVKLDQDGKGTDDGELVSGTDYTLSDLTDKNNKNGFKLEFSNDINSAYRIVYKTKVADRVINDETIHNDVTYGDNNSAGDQKGIGQRVLSKKRGDVDYDAKTVKWTIKINEDKRTMNEVVLTDVFDRGGLKYLGDLQISPSQGVEGTGYSITPVGNSDYKEKDGFKIEFNNPITEPITITYTTSFDSYKLRAGETEFYNVANLVWKDTDGKEQKKGDVWDKFSPRNEVKNNGFKNGDYDATTKKITWTVGANYNKRNLAAGAVLEDPIPDGQKYVDNSLKVYKLSYGANGNPSNPKNEDLIDASEYAQSVVSDDPDDPDAPAILRVKFNNAVDYAFYVVFDTEFVNEDINQSEVKNIATLKDKEGNDVSKPLEKKLDVPKGGEYISKTGTQDTNDQTQMNWSITINANQSDINKVKIVDTPTPNQILLPDSFKLFKTTVSKNGTVTKTNDKLTRDVDYTLEISSDQTGETFTLELKNPIKEAYILEYNSIVTAVGNNVIVNNQVDFSAEGKNEIKKPFTSKNDIRIIDTSGSGSGVRGSLVVTKTNADDTEKLKDAEFALFRLAGTQQTEKKEEKTDSNGILEFKDLRAGKYVLKETKAPAGYALDPTEHPVTINSSTAIALTLKNDFNGSLRIIKVADEDTSIKLEGAEFELYDSNDQLVGRDTTNSDGEIVFTKLKGGEYTLKEIKAPTGYVLDTSRINVTIDPSQELKKQVSNKLIPTATPTPTATPSPTPVVTPTPTVEPTPTPTVEPTPTPTVAPTPTPTVAPTPTPTVAPTPTPTVAPTPTPTVAPTPTPTVAPTPTPTVAPTPTPTVTPTPTPTVAPTPTPTPVATPTPTPTPVATPTPTPTPVATPTPTPTPVATPTPTPTPVATPTPTPTPVATPTPTPTPVATPTPTPTPVATPTPTPTPVATPTPTPTPVATPTPTASATPETSASPTVAPPTEEPTATPSAAPTATPVPTSPPTSTFEPVATPTPVPGVIVTPTPWPSPGASVTPSATPSATPPATPSATPPATPTVVPSAGPTTTPAQPTTPATPVPQVTPPVKQETTTEEVPIEGEIPLGGVPSVGDKPAHGKVTLKPNGKWVYTPDPGFIGKDKFTIIVTDKDGNEEEIVIEIDVEEVPKGTVTGEPDGNGNSKGKDGKPSVLPKTGEDSPLPIYLVGGSLIILGYVLSRRFRRGGKQE